MYLRVIALSLGLALSQAYVLSLFAQSIQTICSCGKHHSGPCLAGGVPIQEISAATLPTGHYYGDGHVHVLPIGLEPVEDDAVQPIAAAQIGNRWTSTATDGFVGNIQGTPVTLTWGIVPDGTDINNFAGEAGPSNLISFLDEHVGNAADPNVTDLQQKSWFPIFQAPYERWEQVSGLTFNFEENDDGIALEAGGGVLGVRPDLRISGVNFTNASALAFNSFPNSGDGLIDTGNTTFFGNSGSSFVRLRNVIAHEVGHGIGFNHVTSSDASFLLSPTTSAQFDGPQFDDILAVHRNYGDVLEKNGGNDSFATATSLGSVSAGDRIAMGLDASETRVGADDIDFYSIDDNSDKDFFQFTLDSRQTISLSVTPQGPTYSMGPEGGTQSVFPSRRSANLAFNLFNGSQDLIVESSSAGFGETELLTNYVLEPGNYFVELGTRSNATQFYRLDLKTESDDRVFLVDEDFADPGDASDPGGIQRSVARTPPDEIEFTLTAGDGGLVGLAPKGFLAEGDALASSRDFDASFESVTNTVEFTVDATGLAGIELELVAFQHGGSYEGTENLLIEVDTGDGFFTLLQDFEVWNGVNDLVGEGTFGRDGNDTPTSTGPLSVPGAANRTFDVKISMTSDFVNFGGAPASTAEVYYLDSLFVTGAILIPEPTTLVLLGCSAFWLNVRRSASRLRYKA